MASQGESPYSIIDGSYFVSEIMTSAHYQWDETRKPLLHCRKTSTKSKSLYNQKKKKAQRYMNMNIHSK